MTSKALISCSLLPFHHTLSQGTHTRRRPPSPLITHRVLLTPQLLAFATDELSIRVGETLAGLLNATLVRTSFPLILRLTKTHVRLQGNA